MADIRQEEGYWISVKSGGNQMPSMHSHDSYELYYLEAGRREYFVEEKLFSVCAGEFVLIPPGKLHRTGGQYGTRILADFSASFLTEFYSPKMTEQLLRCFQNVKLTPEGVQQETCKYLIKKLLGCQDRTAVALTLGMLLQELGQCGAETLQDDPVSPIVAYINENYAHINTIDQIAAQFYISKFHLCRVFKAAMQITVVDYLNQVRIKNACRFLEAEDADVAEISARCGFNSPAYFSNVFKRITGRSPTEYRKEKKGK